MFFIYFDNGIGDFCLFTQKLFVYSIFPSPDTLFVEQKDYWISSFGINFWINANLKRVAF